MDAMRVMSCDIVSIVNRKSGKALEQTADGSIVAERDAIDDLCCQWIRLHVGDGYFAYKNVSTGNVLDHWYAEEGKGNLVAKNADANHPNHMWWEEPSSDVFVLLRNYKSHKVIDHYFSKDVRVDGTDSNENREWCLVWHRTESADDVTTVVTIENYQSRKLLEHDAELFAHASQATDVSCHWRRVPGPGGYYTYMNIASRMLLAHHAERGVFVEDGHPNHKAFHWRELNVANGFVALKNRSTGHVLGHYNEQSIRAADTRIQCANDLWRIVQAVEECKMELSAALAICRDAVTFSSHRPRGFGDVRLARWDNLDVVVKGIDINTFAERRSFFKEVEIWSRLRHPHIVSFLGANVREKRYFFVCEYAPNGTFFDYYLSATRPPVWEPLYQIAAGLQYLHEQGIIHGDLNPGNVMTSDSGMVKLIDFGLSFRDKATSITMRLGKNLGAMEWRAPELVMGKATNHSFASDVYSLGMCILAALHRSPWPWGYGVDEHRRRDMLMASLSEGSVPVARPDETTTTQWRLIQSLVAVNARERPSLPRLLDTLRQFASNEENPHSIGSSSAHSRVVAHMSRRDWEIEALRCRLS